MWLWKISSADAFFEFTILAILFDKVWVGVIVRSFIHQNNSSQRRPGKFHESTHNDCLKMMFGLLYISIHSLHLCFIMSNIVLWVNISGKPGEHHPIVATSM